MDIRTIHYHDAKIDLIDQGYGVVIVWCAEYFYYNYFGSHEVAIKQAKRIIDEKRDMKYLGYKMINNQRVQVYRNRKFGRRYYWLGGRHDGPEANCDEDNSSRPLAEATF